jgi:hypothetical protein
LNLRENALAAKVLRLRQWHDKRRSDFVKDKRQIEGRWWIFGSDTPPHYGLLHYDPNDGLNLEVKIPEAQTFQQVMAAPWAVDAPDVISGRDADDKIVTLFGCSSPASKRSGGMVSYKLHPLRAVIGRAFSHWGDVSFDNVQVEYSLLHEWLGRSSISVDFNTDRAAFTRKEDITFDLLSGAKLSLGAFVSAHHASGEFQVSEGHWAEFTLQSAISVDRLFDSFVLVFRRFLTLLVGKRVFVDSIKFENGKVELLQQNTGVEDADRSTHALNMIASFADLGQDAGTIFRRWFEYHERLEPALNLYFAVMFNRSLYSNHRFLFLAQALEVYHRINPSFTGAVQPSAEFRERVSRLISAVEPEEQSWVKEKLQHANEKTLAQRIEEILSTAPSEVDQFIPDREDFAAKVRHTRNYYTHFLAELREKGKAADDEELPRLTEQMRGLLLLCILRDLGISGKPAAKVAHSVYSLRFVSL